ncbi:MAG TPA: hypothetical protein VK205_09370 [Prolixibacteraceae bacterium]|nr:hypothetical protein [Prolixibacteraceae bacterium]
MKQLPLLLIKGRIVIAFAFATVALAKPDIAPVMIVSLMAMGPITDILDGIISRQSGIAIQRLRGWDSNAGQFF